MVAMVETQPVVPISNNKELEWYAISRPKEVDGFREEGEGVLVVGT